MRAPPPPTLPTGFYQLGNIARLGAGGAGILWYDGEGWAELGTRHVNSSQRGTQSPLRTMCCHAAGPALGTLFCQSIW